MAESKLKSVTVEPKRYSLMDITGKLHALANMGNHAGARFAYAVDKNRSILEREYELIAKRREMPTDDLRERFKKYNEEVIDLIAKHGGHDLEELNRKNKSEDLIFDKLIPASARKGFEADKRKLDDKYKDTIDEMASVEKKNRQLAQEKVAEITFHRLLLDDVPDTVTVKEMEALRDIVVE